MCVRIVVPIHSFEPGGVERVALRLAANWQDAGDEVTVVLGRSQGSGRIEEADRLRYRSYRSPIPTARCETIWMIICLYRYLRRERADILFCPGNTYTFVCAAMRLLLGRRCPPVVAKISNDLCRADLPGPARWGYHVWVRAHGWFIARFVALADPMAPEIIEQVRVPARRVSVIPDPALTTAEFARLSAVTRRKPLSDGALIVSVGRLVGQKNFALLLSAFASHAPPADSLLIAGDGPDLPRLRQLAVKLGIGDRVTFAGHCTDVPALLERADIFALSSVYEGLPAVVVEALAAGIPIVTTDCSACMSWLTGFGADGIVVPVGQVARFGRAIHDIRELPMPSATGRIRAAEFTVEKAASKYRALFEAVFEESDRLQGRRPRRGLKQLAQYS
jgi:glycosyltransferase involved in cell wall biosynthesis